VLGAFVRDRAAGPVLLVHLSYDGVRAIGHGNLSGSGDV
jgi:hypothetical protein